MKIPFLFIMIFAWSLFFLVVTDLLSGMSLAEALRVLQKSLAAPVEELAIMAIALCAPFIPSMAAYFKKLRSRGHSSLQ